MSDWGFETRQVHAGAEPDPTTGARAIPIYQTTSYVFRDTEHAAALFGLEELGNIYTRIMNPTQAVFEDRLTALEGGVGALAAARGQAAETIALLNLAENGGHIVVGRRSTAARTTSSTTRSRSSASRSASSTTPTTSTRGAPRSGPTRARSTARRSGTRRATSSTSRASAASRTTTGSRSSSTTRSRRRTCASRSQWGADIVVHSATKFIGGHGTSIGGIIVDGGKFDYVASGRFANFTEPDPSYHGLVFSQLPEPLRPAQYILKARLQYQRDIGAAVSPFNSFLFLQGLETLSLRMERHSQNALAVAKWLEARDEVEWVAYPGLASSRWNDAGEEVPPQRPERDPLVRHQGWDGGRQAVHQRARAASATSPTSATCAASRSTRRARRTRSSRRSSRSTPASRPTSCASRSASSRSTTSSPTSRRASAPRRARSGRRSLTGA